MPVTRDLVPLDTAKSWAKRLSKTSKTLTPNQPWPLASCQLAVAQMLGFKHWHALAQGLAEANTPVENHPLIPPKPRGGWDTALYDANNWQKFWQDMFGTRGVSKILISGKHGQPCKIEMSVFGKQKTYVEMDSVLLTQALNSIMSDKERVDFISSAIGASTQNSELYADIFAAMSKIGDCELHVGGYKTKAHFYCMETNALNVTIYPTLIDKPIPKLQDIGFPKDVAEALSSISKERRKALVFSGLRGSGKTSLMHSMLLDINKNKEEKRVYTMEHVPATPGGGSRAMLSSIPVEQHLSDKGTKKSVIQKELSKDPDVLLISDIQCEKSIDVLRKAVKKDTSILASIHAHDQKSIEKLFQQKAWANQLRGWVWCSNLPLLCQLCSTPKGDSFEREEGPGCNFCGGLGVVGMQQVISIFKIEDGITSMIISKDDQARDLVNRGKVAWKDVENRFGTGIERYTLPKKRKRRND